MTYASRHVERVNNSKKRRRAPVERVSISKPDEHDVDAWIKFMRESGYKVTDKRRSPLTYQWVATATR